MLSEDEAEEVNTSNPHWEERESMVPNALEKIEEHFGTIKGLSLLDAGCAQGSHTYEFARKGIEVHGIDQEVEYIRDAREKKEEAEGNHLPVFTQGDIEDLPYEDERFDIVFCVNTLFYTDHRKSLPELERVLKPGGLGIVMINEEIRNLDEDEIYHERDLEEALTVLENSEIITTEYGERVDQEPFRHRHKYYLVVYEKQ